jgi:sugar/nucleoside kinase (ribokinase family)
MKKVLGMGNALVDIIIRMDNDDILNEYNLPKGSMQLVNRDFISKILVRTSAMNKQICSGGSAANTIHGLARLGVPAAYIGKVGSDDFSRIFEDDLKSNNINPFLFKSVTETGRAIALVSPDTERTFTTYLGSAIELSPDELKEELFHG